MSLQLCSCKEHEALLKEQASLKIELKKAKEAADAYQARLSSLGPAFPPVLDALEAQVAASDKTNTQLTQEIGELQGKATRLEEAFKTLRPKVESYKTKYLR